MSRGTGFAIGNPFPKDHVFGKGYSPFAKSRDGIIDGHEQCHLHSMNKPTGLAWVDSLSWLAKNGQTFTAFRTVADAIKAKAVKELTAYVDGKPITVWVHSKFDASKKYPHSIATLAFPSGRIETRQVSDARNVPLVKRISFDAPKPAKASAVAQKPAKAKPAK